MNVRLREDLERQELNCPACFTYSSYDEMTEPFYLSAKTLRGAVLAEMSEEESDSTAFTKIRLKDGRIVYMYGADLEMNYGGKWL